MNEEQYLLFENYLNNDLNFEDKENFENELKSNSEFAEAFEIYKDLNSHLSLKFQVENDLNAFKQNLSNASGTLKKSKIISIKPIYYAIAACFALIFGIMVFNNSNKVPTFVDYYEQQNANFTERGDVLLILKQAQDAFNKDDYKLAASLFETILKTYPRPEIEFFYGISLMQIDKYYEAEVVFNKLIKTDDVFKNTATWNLALLKLKQKDYSACKKILQTIPKDYEDYSKVEDLIDHL